MLNETERDYLIALITGRLSLDCIPERDRQRIHRKLHDIDARINDRYDRLDNALKSR